MYDPKVCDYRSPEGCLPRFFHEQRVEDGLKLSLELRGKLKNIYGDRVKNYIRYDNYNNRAYMNFAYWENGARR